MSILELPGFIMFFIIVVSLLASAVMVLAVVIIKDEIKGKKEKR